MITRADFAYVQARVQSRHGERPDETTWQRLHASRELGHLLETARSSGLAGRVERISVRSDAHAIDRALRRELRDHVAEVASWTPRPWRRAVRWTGRLIDLPAVERLLGDEPVPAWMHDDPALGPFAEDDPGARRTALHDAGLGALVDAIDGGRTAREGWRDRFGEMLPADPGRRAEVESLVDVIERHVRRMGAERGADGWQLRRGLREEIEHVFRWNALRPVAVFAHLALVALDLERLRGALLRRQLFAETESEVSWV